MDAGNNMNRLNRDRVIIQALTETLEAYSMLITEENGYTPTKAFLEFLEKHLCWLDQLDNDWQLYDAHNKEPILEIIGFVQNPDPYFEGCIRYMDELIDIAIGFRRIHSQISTVPAYAIAQSTLEHRLRLAQTYIDTHQIQSIAV